MFSANAGVSAPGCPARNTRTGSQMFMIQIDANPKLQRVSRPRHRFLEVVLPRDRAFDGVEHTSKLDEVSVAGELDDTPATARDKWFGKFLAQSRKALQRARFVALDKTGVANPIYR